ncbi:MAG TPA: hypothetical protein VGS21_00550, partial [Acidimicrobiales bacterium]|nr:hypothetical protein [Acidimicrobiales bacterium]
AALDPGCQLWLFDGKLVELLPFMAVAERFVGADLEEASDALDALRREMEARFGRLLARRSRKVEQGDPEPIVVVVIDELAFYVAGTDKRQSQDFSDRLRDIVARGRAAGIVVVAATQKPSTDLIPSALRDNFSFRLAHRCATRDASDTILGAGWASLDYSASSIDPAQRGVGYLLAEGGLPRRMRTYNLSDDGIEHIVQLAVRSRGGSR